MANILAFAGSNHTNSINFKLVELTIDRLQVNRADILDIRSWNIPMYSIDMDQAPVQTPELINQLIEKIETYDGFIIASPEHNGATSAFFKNILDWLSRRKKNVFDNKPVFLMSTSPGKGGAATNLAYLVKSLPFQGADVVAHYSLPSFYDNVNDGELSETQSELLSAQIQKFEAELSRIDKFAVKQV
jgi:NAD(P)H-dependent FMN reductase